RSLAGDPRGRAGRPPAYAPLRGAVGTLIDQGFTALRRGQHETARRAWQAALELDPSNRTLALNLRRLDALGAECRARGQAKGKGQKSVTFAFCPLVFAFCLCSSHAAREGSAATGDHIRVTKTDAARMSVPPGSEIRRVFDPGPGPRTIVARGGGEPAPREA